MRDWMKALRPASFRGVRFWVEADSPDVGRRVAVHEISGSEAIVTEDMGRRTRSVFVAAYVVGDRSDGEAHALEAACEAPGASLLALPMDRSRIMHCLSCRRDRRRDAMGYVAYDLEFVEAGSAGAFGGGGLGALRGIFDAGIATASRALSSLF